MAERQIEKNKQTEKPYKVLKEERGRGADIKNREIMTELKGRQRQTDNGKELRGRRTDRQPQGQRVEREGQTDTEIKS
jgi:hypothetical protein